MSSSRLFSKGKKADFRREIPWFIMYCLIFVFAIPIAYLFGMPGDSTFEAALSLAEKNKRLFNYAADILGMGGISVILMGTGLLEAYHEFGYLHRKQEIDFFHSLPVTRRQMFFGRFTNGVKTVLVPYICALLTGLISAALTGLSFKEMLPLTCTALVLNTGVFLMSYAVGILAVMLTGRALTGILGMAVLMGYFPMLSVVLDSTPSVWFDTYKAGTEILPIRWLLEMSPCTQLIRYLNVFQSRFMMPPAYDAVTAGFLIRVLLGFAAAAVLVLIDLKLYDMRPLEKAGDGMIFRKTEPVIRVLLVVFAALGTMQFMRSISDRLGWVLFFTLAVTALGHILVELIYRADPKKVLRHKVELGVILLAAAALILILHFDLTGYNRYLPKEEKIEAAELHFTNTSNQDMVWQVDTSGEEYVSWSQEPEYWFADPEKPVADGLYKEAEEIGAVRAIAEKGIEYCEEIRKNGTQENADEAAVPLSVTWHLAGGKEVSRSYWVRVPEIHDEYETLFDSETGRNYMFPVLSIDTDTMIGEIQYEECGNVIRLDKNVREEVLDAYLMDLRAMNMADIEKKAPVAMLRIGLSPEMLRKLGLDDMAEDLEAAAAVDFKYGGDAFFRYPLYDSFARTLEVLEREGITPVTVYEKTAATENFEVNGWGFDQNGNEQYFSDAVTTPDDIETVRKYLVLGDYSYYNMYGPETVPDLGISWSVDGKDYTGILLDNEETQELTDRYYREHQLIRNIPVK
ncbi:MAG: hypothetical protein E7240_08200 [Lachnospiraceae bacterium]|nr:hypothetical protein [Lachnospiraceae bacterium]